MRRVKAWLWARLGHLLDLEAVQVIEFAALFACLGAALLMDLPGLNLVRLPDAASWAQLAHVIILPLYATLFAATAMCHLYGYYRGNLHVSSFSASAGFSLWLGLTVAVIIAPLISFAMILCPLMMALEGWLFDYYRERIHVVAEAERHKLAEG